MDRRGRWLFRVVPAGVLPDLFSGTRLWVTTLSPGFSLASPLSIHALSPAGLRTPLILAGQVLVALGVSVLLGDILLFKERPVPFIHIRTGSIANFP